MEKHLEHLLSRYGILTSFSIAKRFDDESIKKISERIQSVSKNKIDFDKKLRNEIKNETTNSILKGNIPGLIIDGKNPEKNKNNLLNESKKLIYNIDKKKLAELYTLASAFNKEVLNNKLSKNDICFVIYTILNFLEVTDEDFKKFHQDLINNQNNDNLNSNDNDDVNGDDDSYE